MPRISGLGWYALAAALFLAGIVLAAALTWRFIATFEHPARFLAPGATEVVLQPGNYVLWHEHRTVFGGKSFDLPAAMPNGTRYRVQAPDGSGVALQSYSPMSSQTSRAQSVSVAQFGAGLPGPYRVVVEGDFEPRVLAVAPNRLWPILRLVGVVLATLALSLGAAIAVGLYGFLRGVPVAAGAPSAQAEASLRKLVALVYGLQAASLLVGVTLIAAVIVNYLRRGEAAGTWLESHFTWQIRTFWWSLAWCILGFATAVLIVGFFILLASAVWFVYRIVKGWTELDVGRPMYRSAGP